MALQLIFTPKLVYFAKISENQRFWRNPCLFLRKLISIKLLDKIHIVTDDVFIIGLYTHKV